LGLLDLGSERLGLQLFVATDFDGDRGLQCDRILQDSTRFCYDKRHGLETDRGLHDN
jgi:hypothetical protein